MKTIVFLVTLLASAAQAQMMHEDIVYAEVAERALKLDLHLPAQQTGPLIVYVHGGAWRSGSKRDVPLLGLVKSGYAIASVDYRLTPEAAFPANVHDIKAAIRFLRAKQVDYRLDAERVVIAGSSAGGHLAALVGVSNGSAFHEGDVGAHHDQSSAVQGILSYYGASNLTTILSQSTPHGLKMRVPALELLLDGQPDQKPELAQRASPVFQLDPSDPPLFLIHGGADPQMPPEQSAELAKAYQKNALRVDYHVLQNSVHGGDEFYDGEALEWAKAFLKSLQ